MCFRTIRSRGDARTDCSIRGDTDAFPWGSSPAAAVNIMTTKLYKGAEFLVTEVRANDVLTPEDCTSEQRMIAEISERFVLRDVTPHLDAIEDQRFDIVLDLLHRCGDLGLLMIDVPKDFGGLELGKVTSMLVQEKIAPTGSFAVSYLGHTGIGILPLIYYGSKQQKEKYLEKLSTGEWVAAYCLTEPDAGSDALAVKCTAVRSPDGKHYILNGIKQFTTNGGIADLLTVFAKVDSKHFTAFLVERSFEGVSSGPEEKKMGIKGSSTVQMRFDNVRVPVENLLGEVGKGHKIAFNILNISRLKLGAFAIGAAKAAFAEAAKYAANRKQFGVPIGSFGAIQQKLAAMAAAIFAAESLVYRLAGMFDDRLETIPRQAPNYYDLYLKGTEEYAIECAIAKVFCTEMLSTVVDEVVQIHGGYGYMQDYSVERYYRDSRIHRIYEGTNEINRLLIARMILRRCAKGELCLSRDGEDASGGPTCSRSESAASDEVFTEEKTLVAGLKKMFLVILEAAEQQCRETLENEQEILLSLADMVIQIFAVESTTLRAENIVSDVEQDSRDVMLSAAKMSAYNAAEQTAQAARKVGFFLNSGNGQARLFSQINSLGWYDASGLLEAARQLANASMSAENYVFGSSLSRKARQVVAT